MKQYITVITIVVLGIANLSTVLRVNKLEKQIAEKQQYQEAWNKGCLTVSQKIIETVNKHTITLEEHKKHLQEGILILK